MAGKVECTRYPREKCVYCENGTFEMCDRCESNAYRTRDADSFSFGDPASFRSHHCRDYFIESKKAHNRIVQEKLLSNLREGINTRLEISNKLIKEIDLELDNKQHMGYNYITQINKINHDMTSEIKDLAETVLIVKKMYQGEE